MLLAPGLIAAVAAAVHLRAPVVLGSGSTTRAAILRELGVKFEVHKPDIDEKAIRYEDPSKLVLALGKAKAAALMEDERFADLRQQWISRGSLILTGDQVVVCGGHILEKPESEHEARRFIAGYAQHAPSTVGSCVVTDPATGMQWAAVDTATVHFEPIAEATVDKLLAEGEVFHCAGGLMVEHALVAPHVSRMDGSIDSVMGLCKETAVRLLREAEATAA